MYSSYLLKNLNQAFEFCRLIWLKRKPAKIQIKHYKFKTPLVHIEHTKVSQILGQQKEIVFFLKNNFHEYFIFEKKIKEKDGQVSPYGNLVKSATEKLKNSRIESELSERVGFRKIYLVCS